MLHALARNWWLVALRGLLAILFGVLALAWPPATVAVLVIFFGAWALVDGIFALGAAVTGYTGGAGPGGLLLEGVAGIAAGILTFLWPGITALVLLYLIAAWAIVTGIFEVVAAIRLRREITGEFWLALGGVISVIFGLFVFFRPVAAAEVIAMMIGIYALVFGFMMIGLAFRLRRLYHRSAHFTDSFGQHTPNPTM